MYIDYTNIDLAFEMLYCSCNARSHFYYRNIIIDETEFLKRQLYSYSTQQIQW